MKKIQPLLILSLLLGLSTGLFAQTSLSKAERTKAAAHLKSSQKALFKAIKGLSDQQLNFKPDADSWSIAECVEHIAVSEKTLFGLAQQTLEGPADPDQKANRKMSDEEVVEFIAVRNSKIKTQDNLEPKNSFGSIDGSKGEFKTLRKQSIKYIKTTDDDLRNHFFDFPFGKVDTYQIILFMSGHSTRHIAQIQEIKENSSFPAG